MQSHHQDREIPNINFWKPGEILLNEYRVIRKLGHGGIGVVYLVSRIDNSEYSFAVKALQTSRLFSPNQKRNFIREIRTWIDLPSHPNLVKCWFFRTVNDRFAIFSEYVDGISARDWINSNSSKPIETILDFGIQVAWGIHAAHENGVIHQDIKPNNILIDNDGVAKVTDFGLSQTKSVIFQELRGTESDMETTQASTCGMTPAYCSPEQAARGKIGRRTDMFSWAVMLLEVFLGDLRWKYGIMAPDVLRNVTLLDSATENPAIPEGVVSILTRCFQRDPADRYPSMMHVADAVAVVFESMTGKKYPRQKTIQRKFRSFASSEARITSFRDRWDDPVVWYQRAEILFRLDPGQVKCREIAALSHKGRALADLELFDELQRIYINFIKTGRTDTFPDLASIYWNKSRILGKLGDIDGSLKEQKNNILLLEEACSDPNSEDVTVRLIHAYQQYADILGNFGKAREALQWYDKAFKLSDTVQTIDSADATCIKAHIQINQAITWCELGDYPTALKLVNESVAQLDNIYQADPTPQNAYLLIFAVANQSSIMMKSNSYTESLERLNEAIALIESLQNEDLSEEHRDDLPVLLVNKSILLMGLNDPVSALENIVRANAIREQLVFDTGHFELRPELARGYYNQSCLLCVQGKFQESLQTADKAIDLLDIHVYKEGNTDQRLELARFHKGKAMVLIFTYDFKTALHHLNIAVKILESSEDATDRIDPSIFLAQTLTDTTICHDALDEFEEAHNSAAQAVRILDKIVHDEGKTAYSNDLAFSYFAQIRVFRSTSNWDSMLENGRKTLEIWESICRETHRRDLLVYMAKCCFFMGLAHEQREERTDAERFFVKSIDLLKQWNPDPEQLEAIEDYAVVRLHWAAQLSWRNDTQESTSVAKESIRRLKLLSLENMNKEIASSLEYARSVFPDLI